MGFMTFQFINRVLLVLLFLCVRTSAQITPPPTSLPSLRLISSNGVSTVFWPLWSYSAILQTAVDLAPESAWTNLATGDQAVALNTFSVAGGSASYVTNVVGDELAVALPATGRQQFFRLSTPPSIPACCFAIFYNGLLEFSQSATMVVNGRVHANGPIYVGTSASLNFNAPVTTTSTLTAPLVDGLTSGWSPGTPTTWNTTFGGNPTYVTNTAGWSVSWYSNNPHFLIDVPPAGEPPASAPGKLRLFNQAQIVLLVTNDLGAGTNPTVTLRTQTSIAGDVPGNDPLPAILYYTNASPDLLRSNLSFLSLTNRSYDQREMKTNLFTQIDLGKFAAWIATNLTVQGKLPAIDGQYPTILYVADRRNVNARQLASVRLVNGAQLPANNNRGFTVATMNPLYISGSYNVQTSGSGTNTSAGTTNTTYTVPAALLSDALTILSPNWTDDQGYSAYNNSSSAFDAADMTINAAILIGNVPSTGTSGTNFSGGVHNLARLLEDWSGKNLWLNTSLIRPWDSNLATNQFRNPQGFNPAPVNPYYNPPTRHYSFDLNYLDPAKIPPGMPSLFYFGSQYF